MGNSHCMTVHYANTGSLMRFWHGDAAGTRSCSSVTCLLYKVRLGFLMLATPPLSMFTFSEAQKLISWQEYSPHKAFFSGSVCTFRMYSLQEVTLVCGSYKVWREGCGQLRLLHPIIILQPESGKISSVIKVVITYRLEGGETSLIEQKFFKEKREGKMRPRRIWRSY